MVSSNLSNGPKHRGSFLKDMASSEGVSYLQELSMLLWINQRLIHFKLQSSGIENKSSYINNIFLRGIQAMYASFAPKYLHLQDWYLEFEQNIKRSADVSGSSHDIEASCKNKLKLTKLKDLCFKKKMNVRNRNCKTLKFQLKRYHFRL